MGHELKICQIQRNSACMSVHVRKSWGFCRSIGWEPGSHNQVFLNVPDSRLPVQQPLREHMAQQQGGLNCVFQDSFPEGL